MRFIICGAGGIGGLVAARLSQAGYEVVAIARGAHRDRMREAGLRVEAPDGSAVIRLDVAGDPSELGFRDGDVVLLAVKSQDTLPALEALAACVSDVPVFCLQNGVENERTALRLFDDVYGVYVMCPATFLEPGVVRAESAPCEGIFDIGRWPDGTGDVAGDVSKAFESSTFSARVVGDVARWKYAKLLGNLANAVEAICVPGERNAELVRAARAEGRASLDAAGIAYASDDEVKERRDGLLNVGGGGRAHGSTWQSLARATRSIETNYLNGEIVLLGRLHGVPTPVNALLQRRAAALSRAGAPPASLNAEALLSELGR